MMIRAQSNTSASVTISQADGASTPGSVLTVTSGNNVPLSVSSGKQGATVNLSYDNWYRFELTNSALIDGADNYNLTVTDSQGNSVTQDSIAFSTALDSIQQLIFSALTPNTTFTIDNVSVAPDNQ